MTDLHKTIIAIGIANSTAEIRGLPATRRYGQYVDFAPQVLAIIMVIGFIVWMVAL